MIGFPIRPAGAALALALGAGAAAAGEADVVKVEVFEDRQTDLILTMDRVLDLRH